MSDQNNQSCDIVNIKLRIPTFRYANFSYLINFIGVCLNSNISIEKNPLATVEGNSKDKEIFPNSIS